MWCRSIWKTLPQRDQARSTTGPSWANAKFRPHFAHMSHTHNPPYHLCPLQLRASSQSMTCRGQMTRRLTRINTHAQESHSISTSIRWLTRSACNRHGKRRACSGAHLQISRMWITQVGCLVSLFRILFITRPCVGFFRFPLLPGNFFCWIWRLVTFRKLGSPPPGGKTHSAVESLRNDNENACDQCDQLSTRSGPGKPSRVWD